MENTPNWPQYFKIPQTDLSEWQSHAGDEVSLAYWCLIHGKIDAHQYKAWAIEHFQSLYLQSNYFVEQNIDPLWPKYQNQAKWSECILPVGEWDGLLYIGCVEIPQSFDCQHPHVFILAPAHQLQHLWQKWHPEENALPDFSNQAFQGETMISESPEENILEGLDVDEQDTSFPASGNLFEMPPLPESEPNSESLQLNESVETPETDVPPAVPQTPTPPPTPVAPPQAVPREVSAMQPRCEDYDFAFHQLILRYTLGISIFTFENQKLTLKAFNKELQPTASEHTIDLSQPSLFRVAYRTLLPYHGPVANSEENSKFFSWLNLEEPPPLVTACPLIQDGELIGMMICCGPEEANNETSLALAEGIAKEVVQKSNLAAA